MTKTEHYQLPQWEAADPVQRVDFNAAFASISENCGNCRIAWGSYVGTGEYGQDHPNVLTFDFVPQVVFLDTRTYRSSLGSEQHIILFRGRERLATPDTTSGANYLSWEEKSISWYYGGSTDSRGSNYQLNTLGRTYHYIVLGTETAE